MKWDIKREDNLFYRKTKRTGSIMPVSYTHLDDLREHGMDSIKFITLIVALEAEYRCEIPDEKLLIPELNTVRKIIDVLNSIAERFEEN